MESHLGDRLVTEEKRLRPSRAFSYVASGEFPPDAYPDLAIEDLRSEYLRAYRDRHSLRRVPLGAIGAIDGLLFAILTTVVQLVILNQRFRMASERAARSGMTVDIAPPRSVAYLRALG